MDATEWISLYRPGGYHPVELGDKFNNRYIVEHKLGHGGYSTVWLARDFQHEHKRLVALKIMMSNESDACLETSFLRRLDPQTHAPPPGRGSASRGRPSFFPTVLDEFTIHGPNGTHRCLVTEVLGPSLCSLAGEIHEFFLFPLAVAKKIAVQLAHAVSELHECGIVHGDLHLNNILFLIRGMESWTTDDIRNYLGEPQKISTTNLQIPLPPDSNVPKYVVCAPDTSNLVSLCLESATIKIIDFGVAFDPGPEGGIRKTIGAPPQFAAPEVQTGYILTPACDVWSLGCLLYSLFSLRSMFIPDMGCRDTLLDLTICFGKLPDPWWGLWKGREEYYHEDGQVKPEMVDEIMNTGNFEHRLSKVPRSEDELKGLQDEEYAWFRRLMYGIFKLDPKERMVAKEVVRYLPPSWEVGTP